MQELDLRGKATINAVTPRKEANGEGDASDKVLAVDVKLSGQFSIRQLVPILGVDSEEQALGTLWDIENEDLRLLNITEIKAPSDCKFHDLDVDISGITGRGCAAGKFVIVPTAGGGVLTMTVTIPLPPTNSVGILAELLQEEVTVAVTSAQQELPLAEAS